MRAYPDTSFLYGFYLMESTSSAVAAYASTMREPLHLTELLRYEFCQSLRFQVWRRARNPAEGVLQSDAEAALNQLEADLASGIAVLVPCSLWEVLRRADDLSKRHTTKGGHRSFGILHVASALVLEVEEFLTFDARQRGLAEAEGLSVKP
ncbi:MAG: type II toxin-antitoxin system VapC family toxin [Verrucomicrobiales bacterium]|nr:type II toxin-antitoxin system VapC family toxin [Verrucomicrobiales bacterium]